MSLRRFCADSTWVLHECLLRNPRTVRVECYVDSSAKVAGSGLGSVP